MPPNTRKRVALVTYGCAKNLVDSEVMLGYLKRAGYSFSHDPEKADVLVLNTCGFIQPAREEARKAIESALALKKRDPRKIVTVAGCFVERYRADLTRRYPEVDAWLGVKDFAQIVPAVEHAFIRRGGRTFLLTHTSPRVLSTPPTWAYLKISEGCSRQCAFCAIPMIKGAYRSRTIPSIVKEAAELASRGVREINLISQDSTFFGRDRGMADGLVRLLRRLVSVPKLRWVRILYGYPEEVTPALLEVMQEEKICAYLDLPFQHADRAILRRMKRTMDGPRALALLYEIRKTLPGVAVRTSLVVGFPGEGRREFSKLKEFVREAQFEHLGVFTYSPERGTSAYRLGDPIPESEKTRRRDEIMEIQAGISASLLKKYLHRRIEILLDNPSPAAGRGFVGRARFQAPEVDGLVLIAKEQELGRPLRAVEKVEITAAEVYDLRGILVG